MNIAAFTHETAPTQYQETGEIRFAYRRFGRGTRVLLFLAYFNSNMDGWDPAVINELASYNQVILVDYPGVASSTGTTPSTVDGIASDCVSFCEALGLADLVVVGFSLGGMVAQQMALEHPEIVDKLILLGTGPRAGIGMDYPELSASEQEDPVEFLLGAFYTTSQSSRDSGIAFVHRMAGRIDDRDSPVSSAAAEAQILALREWGKSPWIDGYQTLAGISQPTLIIHGSHDIVVAPANGLIMAENIPNALLIVYPDSSHGAQYQYATHFLQQARLFLED